jgi:hypothetical protein
VDTKNLNLDEEEKALDEDAVNIVDYDVSLREAEGLLEQTPAASL